MLKSLYSWYGKKTVLLVIAALTVLTGYALYLAFSAGSADEPIPPTLPTIAVAPAGTIGGDTSTQLIGSVAAKSKAEIESESSGRVTSVAVSLGETVRAGQIIANIENASERAAVLQAEGAYESALASAAQSDVALAEAENSRDAAINNALSTYRTNFTTVSDVMFNLLDDFYSNPLEGQIGLRINGGNQISQITTARVVLRSVLSDWRSKVNALSAESDLVTHGEYALVETQKVIDLIDSLTTLVNNEDNRNITLTGSSLSTYSSELIAARQNLVSSMTALDSARTSVVSAEKALERVRISGTASETSTANAQVKQALGALRAAQANLEKTILRTPIAGEVNALAIETGDFVSAFEKVAEVANNTALEITTYVGENDRNRVVVGQLVQIERIIPGTITNIAPAVDSVTRKTEVRIAAEDPSLAAGDTVTISLQDNDTGEESSQRLLIPITAVKFTESNGYVFTVEDNELIANNVTLGDVTGSFVEILSGISSSTVIAVDARGRSAGQKVEPMEQQ